MTLVAGIGFGPLPSRPGSTDRLVERLDLQIGERKLRLRKVKFSLVRAGVDDKQQVARLDVLIVA